MLSKTQLSFTGNYRSLPEEQSQQPSPFFTPAYNHNMIRQICETRIRDLTPLNNLSEYSSSYVELIEQITKIISRNLTSGRAKRVVDKSGVGAPVSQTLVSGDKQAQSQTCSHKQQNAEPQPLVAYVDRVITTYLKEYSRVERLAVGDEAEWVQLHNRLANRAYYALLRRQISATRARDEAMEFAQEACYVIFNSLFPCDVPFDAWTAKILNNLILQRYTRSRDLIDRKPQAVTSLDCPGYQTDTGDEFSLYDLLTDESSIVAFKQVEVQDWLIRAIACLRSQAQQQVIIYTYFYDLSDEEIAKRIQKSKNAVQILRHRALKQLQKILEVEMKE